MAPLWGHRAAGFAAAVAAVIATGCTAQHAGAGAAAPAVGDSAAAAAAAAGAVAARSLPHRIPLNVPNSVSARKAVILTNCTATSLGGLATATVTAPAAKAATYTITVFFTTAGTTVLDYATAVVHATPGKATRWQASGRFKAPQGMRCVLRGVSGG
jgi:hypothetical protein